MTLQYTSQFERDLRTIPLPIHKKLKRQLTILLKHGVRYQGLNAKKMVNQPNIWEARIDLHYRLTFQIHGDRVLLRRIGTHQIYRHP